MESRSTQPEGHEMVQKIEMLEKQHRNEEQKNKMLLNKLKGIYWFCILTYLSIQRS